MANSLEPLTDKEIRLECIRLAVEFAPEIVRIVDPISKAQTYYNWVINKNSKRQSTKTAMTKDQL
jgi:hypothetical protein